MKAASLLFAVVCSLVALQTATPAAAATKTRAIATTRAAPKPTHCQLAVRLIYVAFASGNLSNVWPVLHPDVVWRSQGPSTCITSKTYHGVAGAKKYFDDDAVVFSTQVFVPDDESKWMVTAGGDYAGGSDEVGVAGHESGVYTFDNATRYTNHFFHRWTCGGGAADGAITRFEQFQVTTGDNGKNV
jgi:ketosteroid isomerase-like protein